MNSSRVRRTIWFVSSCLVLMVTGIAAQQAPVTSSYGPTNQTQTFDQIKTARMAVKAARAKAHADLLSSRYVLDARIDPVVKMTGGKPIPVGPTAKIAGVTWEQLGQMAPEQIKSQGLFPYKPLPFADHAEGGMLFPDMTLKLLPRLTRFDLDFDLPEHILPEAAPALYLTTRPDLGDVARGRLVTMNNYYEIKDSPPYLHDGRCFTLEDTVEYFNLVLQLRLNGEEKKDVVAFLRTL